MNKPEEHQINTKALYHALYELLELNWFIADTSRLLQQEGSMSDEGVVSAGYNIQLAKVIEKASNKTTELYEVIEKAMNVKLYTDEHKPKIGLFDMPSDVYFYYGNGKSGGVLGNIE